MNANITIVPYRFLCVFMFLFLSRMRNWQLPAGRKQEQRSYSEKEDLTRKRICVFSIFIEQSVLLYLQYLRPYQKKGKIDSTRLDKEHHIIKTTSTPHLQYIWYHSQSCTLGRNAFFNSFSRSYNSNCQSRS